MIWHSKFARLLEAFKIRTIFSVAHLPDVIYNSAEEESDDSNGVEIISV